MAWKGKVCQAIEMLHKINSMVPDLTIALLMIDGGTECQWEQQEVKESISESFALDVKIVLKTFGGLDSFKSYFEDDGAPL